jgi:hypothetical protein
VTAVSWSRGFVRRFVRPYTMTNFLISIVVLLILAHPARGDALLHGKRLQHEQTSSGHYGRSTEERDAAGCARLDQTSTIARHLMTCVWSANPFWNHRNMFYEYFRTDLYWQAMRACGEVTESDTLRQYAMVDSGLPIISLLHATRGRAMQAIHCRSEWLRLADNPARVDHIFALDTDDPHAKIFSRFPSIYMENANGGPVAAWNRAAEVAKGEIIVQLSDDWKPFQGWDTAIVEAIGDTGRPSVLAVSDGYRKDDLLCMAILTRARYKLQGDLFHPEFFSMYSDDWFSHRAFRDGVVIDARKTITFEHVHPAFGKAEMDETYARSNAQKHYRNGRAIFERLKSEQP